MKFKQQNWQFYLYKEVHIQFFEVEKEMTMGVTAVLPFISGS